MVRYGILGFGNHGIRRLVPAFRGARSSLLKGIWRRDTEKARANAQEFEIDQVFETAEELCASQSIDAVLVTSPDALHMQDTLLAISHGKSVLCEKPAAMNVEQVRKMLDSSTAANVQFGIAQNFRYNQSVNLIREWVQQGRIGRPILATAHFCFDAGHSPRQWIYDASLARGGVIGDVGIHCIDALRYVLADNVASVATIAQGDHRSESIETGAALSLEFVSGALGSVMVSFRAEYRTWLEIVGKEGVIHCDDCFTVDRPVQVVMRKKGEAVEIRQVTNQASYSNMLDAFSAAAEGNGVFAAPGTDAVETQMVLDAAYASIHSACKEIVQ